MTEGVIRIKHVYVEKRLPFPSVLSVFVNNVGDIRLK
jgi:hypothetical protein